MKKIYLTLIAALAIPMLSVPIAAQATSSLKTEIKEKNKCKQAATEVSKGEFRAYGQGVSKRDYTSEKKALLRAKGNLISAMKSYVTDTAKEYDKDVETDDDMTMTEEFVSEVTSKAQGTLENYKVICTQQFMLPDDMIESHVCISIPYIQIEKTVEAAINTVAEKKGKKVNPVRLHDGQREAYEKYLKEKANL